MIRYETTEAELRDRIEEEKPGWLVRAANRTEQFVQAGEYNETSSIWSEVKKAYCELQNDKCAYCERQLADPDDGGSIEHDVEHYRPKNAVPVWPAPEDDVSFHFDTGDELPGGYYWLAYEPTNYCVACKKCNTPFKLNKFPIAEARGQPETSPLELAQERPFVPYPIGDLDEDPATLLEFDGVVPKPVKQNGPRWRRARVTIEFFGLASRDELLRERARALVALDSELAILESNLPASRKEQAQRKIEVLRSQRSPHTNCVRCACEAYVADPMRMRELFASALEYLESEGESPGSDEE